MRPHAQIIHAHIDMSDVMHMKTYLNHKKNLLYVVLQDLTTLDVPFWHTGQRYHQLIYKRCKNQSKKWYDYFKSSYCFASISYITSIAGWWLCLTVAWHLVIVSRNTVAKGAPQINSYIRCCIKFPMNIIAQLLQQCRNLSCGGPHWSLNICTFD